VRVNPSGRFANRTNARVARTRVESLGVVQRVDSERRRTRRFRAPSDASNARERNARRAGDGTRCNRFAGGVLKE